MALPVARIQLSKRGWGVTIYRSFLWLPSTRVNCRISSEDIGILCGRCSSVLLLVDPIPVSQFRQSFAERSLKAFLERQCIDELPWLLFLFSGDIWTFLPWLSPADQFMSSTAVHWHWILSRDQYVAVPDIYTITPSSNSSTITRRNRGGILRPRRQLTIRVCAAQATGWVDASGISGRKIDSISSEECNLKHDWRARSRASLYQFDHHPTICRHCCVQQPFFNTPPVVDRLKHSSSYP